MQIHLIAIGQKMPAWVKQGYDEYARRMTLECQIKLVEIPSGKRSKSADIKRILQLEGERMLAAIPKGAEVIALDVKGKDWNTEAVASQMKNWMQTGHDVALLVGGPEGLAPACIERAKQKWSLSRLTYPHPLVRIILAEQLYRATTILKNHPYHKA
jgi:23S rRNA (pseudouridine1915-N3)-methyltransferase